MDVDVDVDVDVLVDVDRVVDGNGNVDVDYTPPKSAPHRELQARSEPPRPIPSNPIPQPADESRMLTFQRLDVYQRAIELLSLVIDINALLPKGNAERADQLVRAAESILRNIAEGAGRWSPADCAKHYKIA
ncbi:MAG: four helix bundle protein, partial [Proteobacteria bacterium]